MTVIFSNAGDEDCEMLRELWKDLDNLNLIELDQYYSIKNAKKIIRDAISQEEDFLILCGHGSPGGLFLPSLLGYAFDETDIPYVKAKNILCIWCNANKFCENYEFYCLTSSMYISNTSEAIYYNFNENNNQEFINETNSNTFQTMNNYIKNNIPLQDWTNLLIENVDKTNAIDTFNRKGMVYYKEIIT